MNIRKALHNDFEDLYSIYMSKDVNPYMAFPIISEKEFQEIFDESLNNLMVLEENNKILAVSAVERGKYRKAHMIYIGKFAVNPDFQGRGVATIFFEKLIKSLKEENIRRIELKVMVKNTKAIKFYEKLGFKREGVMKNRLNENGQLFDDSIMALLI